MAAAAKIFKTPVTLLITASFVVVFVVAIAIRSGIGTAASASADINGDGVVSSGDLTLLTSDWHTSTAAADLNGDGTVNILDLSILLSDWGQSVAGAPFPAAPPVLDNFNRAGPGLGANWTAPAFGDPGTAVINSSTKLTGGSGGDSDAVWTANTFGPNVEAYIDLTTLPAGSDPIDLDVRDSTAGANFKGYYITVTPSNGSWQINRADGSSGATLANLTQSVSAGSSIGMMANGSTISAWYKAPAGSWTQVGSATDSTYNNAGYIGADPVDTTTRIDNFGGGTVTGITNNAFSASFYNNITLSGTPVLVRTDPSINFDWGTGSPDPSINTDGFSADWQGSFAFNSGSYTFTATADDGVRVYIDGNLVIDHWVDEASTTYTYAQTMSAGNHTIKMDYYDNAGDAVAQLSWAPTVANSNPAQFWASNSFMNTPLPGNVTISPSSASWLSMIESYSNGLYNNYNDWSTTIYHATSSTPTTQVYVENPNGNLTLPYQQGWLVDRQSDGHIVVIDDSTGCAYEFQGFDVAGIGDATGAPHRAHAYAAYHIYTGSGAHVADSGHAGGELAYLAGTITAADVNSGTIAHALRYITQSNSSSYVVPGTRSDGGTNGGIPEGQLLRLDPSINLSTFGLDAFQMMVAKALQTYGAYDGDSGGGFATATEDNYDGSTFNTPVDTNAMPSSLMSHIQFINFPFPNPTYDSNSDTSCNTIH